MRQTDDASVSGQNSLRWHVTIGDSDDGRLRKMGTHAIVSERRELTCHKPADVIAELADMDGFNRRDAFALMAAYGIATTSEFKPQLGAVIMYRGNIIGSGRNTTKSDPIQHRYNSLYRTFNNIENTYPRNLDGLHAEIAAIKSIPYNMACSVRYNRATLYVVRVAPGLRYGIGMARPCPACINAIRDAGIRNVIYSTDDGFAKETIL